MGSSKSEHISIVADNLVRNNDSQGTLRKDGKGVKSENIPWEFE